MKSNTFKEKLSKLKWLYLKKSVVNKFHTLYYEFQNISKTWSNTFWFGIPIYKCPLDLWIYQEIIFEIKPDIIIECGTAKGGSALFLAHLCDLMNHGEIVTIDIENKIDRPVHKRIKYLTGSSVSPEIIDQVKKLIKETYKTMVILDSNHTKEHVLKELKLYSQLVTNGSYLIVEDTNINGHPVDPKFGEGPMEAVYEFLKENKEFIADQKREKFYLTFNPNGYLLKIK